MDRRRSPRVRVQLPVQVWGLDAFGLPFLDTAMVTDMSSGGVVLRGVRRRIRVGEILDVRMDRERVQFRVIWTGNQPECGTGEMGLQKMTAQGFLPDSVLAHCSLTAAAC